MIRIAGYVINVIVGATSVHQQCSEKSWFYTLIYDKYRLNLISSVIKTNKYGVFQKKNILFITKTTSKMVLKPVKSGLFGGNYIVFRSDTWA